MQMLNTNTTKGDNSKGSDTSWVASLNLDRLVFNFSVSFSGGGLTRLNGFASWFNDHGGANFLIHPACAGVKKLFPKNRYMVVDISRVQRLFCDFKYLDMMLEKWGNPDFYYSYGIPIMSSVGRFNWLHINNILPISKKRIPLASLDLFKRVLLGPQLQRSASSVDVISVESVYSKLMLGSALAAKTLVSVNGANEQITELGRPQRDSSIPVAVVVGTWRYKAIADSIQVFDYLRLKEPNLRLRIFGPSKTVPRKVFRRPEILVEGVNSRDNILNVMKTARYYISTTLLENSYLAASEGMFMAENSIVSDIGPHRELLDGEAYKTVSIPKVKTRLLVTRRDQLTGRNLCTWDDVIKSMLTKMGIIMSGI